MKQTRKGRTWHFGMKLHNGADKRGIVHTVLATDARTADITQLPGLLHGQGSFSAIRRTGKKPTGRRSPREACATGSIDAPRNGR